MPRGGRTAEAASLGSAIINGPYSLPKKPAVWNALSESLSAPISMSWPMSINAGTFGFLGPSVRAMNEPMCGAATDSGGS